MYLKQYELWQTCQNNCVFCFNKANAWKSDDEAKKLALEAVIEDLDKQVLLHSDLSIELIGGDFFQGQLSNPDVRDLFFKLIEKLKKLGDSNKIKQVVLFVTLTIGEQEELYKTLDILCSDNFEVWVSTSYDTKGRFDDKKLENWKKHMSILSKMSTVHLNTTIILTQAFVESVLSGEFNFIDFQLTYNTTLFFKHPLIMLDEIAKQDSSFGQRERYISAKKDMLKRIPWFLPKREDTLKVMSKMAEIGILDRLMGLDYRADDLDAKFAEEGHWVKTIRNKDKNIESENEAKNPCGHLITYMCYSDSDKCLLCDKDTYED